MSKHYLCPKCGYPLMKFSFKYHRMLHSYCIYQLQCDMCKIYGNEQVAVDDDEEFLPDEYFERAFSDITKNHEV